MNCTDAEQLILLKDSGEISDIQVQTLVEHLSGCAACCELTGDLDSLRKTMKAGSINLPAPSRQTISRIRKVAKRQANNTPWIMSYPWPTVLAAAASITLFVSILRFSPGLSSVAPLTLTAGSGSHAIEIIPLIAMITGSEESPLIMEGDETELTVLANELLRLQDMPTEWPGDKTEATILPEDYQPTTLLWNNTPGPLSGRYG